MRVGVYVARVAGGLRASGALLPCLWWFVLSGGAWPVCALRGCCGVWSVWVVSVWVFGVGCWLWACRSRGAVGRDDGAAGDVDGDGAAGGKGGTVVLAVSGVVKPVRTLVAILGSLGVCIYVPASRNWLISYSPIHLN